MSHYRTTWMLSIILHYENSPNMGKLGCPMPAPNQLHRPAGQPQNNHDVQELWFQQDGATFHTARATIDLLNDRLFLWGYIKPLVYADKPQTLDHLEDNIHRVIADIRPKMLEKVFENWTSRLDYIRANRGSHMPEIIFKM
ncbi:uncharacterized protein TNCV_4919651 [Trichonephila clavipes]|nr:uncharacterized protein TNCV_4919651 [Trichonephila clavipes]